MTFTALKTAAQNATSLVALYQAADAANRKLDRNIKTAQLLSYTHGRAAEAHSAFQMIEGWAETTKEINALWTSAASGKPAEEIVEIIMEARA